jgi:hypothetical protein
MRKKGLAPEMVNIDDYDFASPLALWEEHEHVPTVCVHNDALEMLDLRFLIGITVNISSASEERAKMLFSLCKKARAGQIMASHSIRKGEVFNTGWMDFYYG